MCCWSRETTRSAPLRRAPLDWFFPAAYGGGDRGHKPLAIVLGGLHMSSFHKLMEREIPRLRRYARALTRSPDRADDLVQETLLRAVAKAHLWQAGTDIRAWLFTIMHNQHVNMVRRAMRDEVTIDIEQMSSSLVATTDPTAARQLRELE